MTDSTTPSRARRKPAAPKSAPKSAPKAAGGDAGPTPVPVPQVEVIEEAVEVSREQIETATRTGREVVARSYRTAVGLGSEQTAVLTQVGDDAVKGYEDLVDHGRQAMEALIQSGSILVKGCQDVGTMWLDLARETLDDGAGMSRRLAGCVDPTELAQRQQEMARESLSRATHQAGRIQLRGLDVLENAMAPLRRHMDASLKTGFKPLLF